jgi:thiamine-monophosphate kinase
MRHVLAGGDDYELVFTAPANRQSQVLQAARNAATPVTRIGRIEAEPGLRLHNLQGQAIHPKLHSFDHFAPRPEEATP